LNTGSLRATGTASRILNTEDEEEMLKEWQKIDDSTGSEYSGDEQSSDEEYFNSTAKYIQIVRKVQVNKISGLKF